MRTVILAVLAISVLAQAPSASAIIDGTAASPLTWNWNARVVVAKPDGDEVCSGSVVSPSVILTAAHCVVDEQTNTLDLPSDFTVTTGRTTWNDPASGQVLGVTRVAIYPTFSLSTVQGDVALLQLAAPTTSQVLPLAQPADTQSIATGAATVVAGWGLQSPTGTTLPTQLFTVGLTVQSTTYCSSSLADVTLTFDPATMYCAATSDVGAGTCNGDSGGPAVGLNGANGLIEVGVVSWNREGCVHPDVFAQVAALTPWLDPTIVAMQADATPPAVVLPVVTPPVVADPVATVAAPVAIAAPVTTTPAKTVTTAAKTAVGISFHIHPVTAVAGGIAQLRFWAALPGGKISAHLRVVDRGAVLYARTTPAFTPDGRARTVAWRVPRTLRGALRFCMYGTSVRTASAHVCAALTVRAAR